MTTNTLPKLDPEAVAFFAEHAGTSYNPDRETPEQGAERRARKLARAEAWLKADDDLRVDWVDDWVVGSHRDFYGPDSAYEDREPETCEQATLTNGNVDVLASLGCIDDATDDYRRVIEAELAYEAMPSELVCDCETPDTAECGTCHSTWCAKCHPSPSYRCHWEAEHETDDDEPVENDEDDIIMLPRDLDPDALVVLPAELADMSGAQNDDGVVAVALVDLARHIVAVDADEEGYDADEDAAVTEGERIAYATRRLTGWIANLEANAERAMTEERYGSARDLRMRAGDFRDIIRMLDGTEDEHIEALR